MEIRKKKSPFYRKKIIKYEQETHYIGIIDLNKNKTIEMIRKTKCIIKIDSKTQ